ncbi:hypothetical protein D3C72_1570180 [compost metagenome]
MLGHDPAQGHAQHRAEHTTGHEGTGQGCAHVAGEHRDHHGDADAAIGRFANAHQKTGNKHLLVVFRQGAPQGGQAPEHGHQHQAFDPAKTVGQQRQGKSQQPDHQRNDTAEQAELAVTQSPFALEQGKYRVEHLARHVVGNQQAKGQGEDNPGITPWNAT